MANDLDQRAKTEGSREDRPGAVRFTQSSLRKVQQLEAPGPAKVDRLKPPLHTSRNDLSLYGRRLDSLERLKREILERGAPDAANRGRTVLKTG